MSEFTADCSTHACRTDPIVREFPRAAAWDDKEQMRSARRALPLCEISDSRLPASEGAALTANDSHALASESVRSVFVFPEADLDWVRRQLRCVADEECDGSWVVDAADGSGSVALYVRIESTTDDDAPLYRDWEPAGLEQLRAALGRLPGWSVTADISGRIRGDEEVRAFVLTFLAEGGVAVDDFSDHCWTASEVAEDRTHDGLRFFDYQTDHERSREAGS